MSQQYESHSVSDGERSAILHRALNDGPRVRITQGQREAIVSGPPPPASDQTRTN